MKCSRCGHKNDPGRFICTHCGARLEIYDTCKGSAAPSAREAPYFSQQACGRRKTNVLALLMGILNVLLAAVIVLMLIDGRSDTRDTLAGGPPAKSTATSALPPFNPEPSAAEKRTITIYSFTDEVPKMCEKYLETHPDFGFAIELTVIPTVDGLYEPALDEALVSGGYADIYCVESEFVTKYTQGDMSGYAMPYKDLGINVVAETVAADTARYIIGIGTRPSDKAVVGLGYQSTAGVFIYRRSIAEGVWGTDDPDVIKTKVGPGWDKFFAAAAELKAEGYAIVSGDGDIWRPVENSADKGWIVDGKLYIDPKREEFLDYSKKLADNGYSNGTMDWRQAWYADMAGTGAMPVFGFFGPSWLINYVMAENCGGTVPGEGTYGDWAVCQPPVGFFWGGTWMLANKELENDSEKKAAVAKLIDWITLNCAEDGPQYAWANGALDIFGNRKDTVASGTVMAMSDGTLPFLGGQDMYDEFRQAGRLANSKCITEYDTIIGIIWRDQVRQYAAGDKTREQAIADFKRAVEDRLGFDAW